MITFDTNLDTENAIVASPGVTAAPTGEMTFDTTLNTATNMPFDLDGQQVEGQLIDGDTVKYTGADGRQHSVRFGFGDAGETAKITPEGGFSAGAYAGSTQYDVINQLATEGGFNKIVVTQGPTKKNYGRSVGDLENAAGERLSEKLISEGIVQPSMYLGAGVQEKQYDLLLKRGINRNQAYLLGMERTLSAYDQAKEIVDSVVDTSPTMLKTMAATSDELILGSRAYSNTLRAEIKSLQTDLQNNDLDSEEKKLKEDRLKSVQDALQFNLNYDSPFYAAEDQIQAYSGDKALKQPGTFGGWWNAANRSVIGLESTAAAFTTWSGGLVGNKEWEAWGDDWADEVGADYLDYNTGVDFFDIRGPGSAFKWATETAIEYGPQLAAVWAGAKAGAAAGSVAGPYGTVIGGAIGGIGTGFALAVGHIYRDMPEGERNPHTAAGLALAVGAVDAFGLKGGGLAAKNLLTKDGKDAIVDALIDEKGITRELAEKQVKQHVAEVLDGAGQSIQYAAQQQILKKQGIDKYIKEGLKAAGREGVTEGLQEIIAQGGVAALTSKEIDWDEFAKDIVRNAAAGAIIGGPFGVAQQRSVTGGLETIADINSVVAQYGPESQKRTQESLIEERQRDRYGEKKSVQQIAHEVRQEAEGVATPGISQVATPGATTVANRVKAFVKDPKSAFRSLDRKLNKHAYNKDGTANDDIQTAIGLIARDGVFIGTTVASEIDYQRGQIVSRLPSVNAAHKLVGARNTKKFERIILMDDADLTPTQRDGLAKIDSQIEEVQELVAALAEQSGDTGILTAQQVREGGLYVTNQFDGNKVDKSFADSLVGQTAVVPENGNTVKISRDYANQLADDVRHGRLNMQDAKMLASTDVARSPEFRDKYGTKDTLAALINAADRSISRSVLDDRFGKDGSSLVYLLNRAKENGLSDADYQESIDGVKTLMEVYNGTHQRIENPYVKGIANGMIGFTTLRLMDTNAFANFGEMFYGTIGLAPKDKFKYFGKVTKNFFDGVVADYYSVPTEFGAPYTPVDVRDMNNKDIKRLLESGHVLSSNDILYTEGVNTSSPFLQKSMKILYKLNLVNAQTNAMRATRMSFAMDTAGKMLEKIRVDKETGNNSDTGRWARDRLNRYGLDPDRLIEIIDKYNLDLDESIGETQALTPAEAGFLSDQVRLLQINFTDEFSARPQPGSTPAIFESEIFRPFTQFKRFLAHVTANIIPNMWKNYIRRGPPEANFDVFSSLVLVYASAFLAQRMKDVISYGETPEWIEDPDEDFFESEIYRAINYTGFLGTPEYFLEELNNLWVKSAQAAAKDENPIGTLLTEIASIAPVIGVTETDIRHINEGGTKAKERVVGAIPFAGSLKATRDPLLQWWEDATSKEQ